MSKNIASRLMRAWKIASIIIGLMFTTWVIFQPGFHDIRVTVSLIVMVAVVNFFCLWEMTTPVVEDNKSTH